jgi:hypothetical protein
MIIPSRRKLGAAALIIAGIGAFLVPFLLHSPSTQGTSSNNGGTNPNNGNHNPNPTTTTSTTRTPPGGREGTPDTGTCSDENSDHNEDVSDQANQANTNDNNDLSVSHNAKDSAASHNTNGNHGNAYGLMKNQLDKTVALVKTMGTHNGAFHSHHDTKTDNDTVHTHNASSESSKDHDSSCAEKEETNDD